MKRYLEKLIEYMIVIIVYQLSVKLSYWIF